MDDFVDHEGEAMFADTFNHITAVYEDTDGLKDIDIIKTNGNIWLSGNQVMEVMGFNAAETKHTGRALSRIDHPDIIKITDTPFRFTDGRRNRGSLVSPRAVMIFCHSKTKGLNPIRANRFTEWMTEHLLDGHDAAYRSPAKQAVSRLEPVFREVIIAKHEIEDERLDPMRPSGPYKHTFAPPLLRLDEVEFCEGKFINCPNRTACWCKRKGGIRTYDQEQQELRLKAVTQFLRKAPPTDLVIDREDDPSHPGWIAEALASLAVRF